MKVLRLFRSVRMPYIWFIQTRHAMSSGEDRKAVVNERASSFAGSKSRQRIHGQRRRAECGDLLVRRAHFILFSVPGKSAGAYDRARAGR